MTNSLSKTEDVDVYDLYVAAFQNPMKEMQFLATVFSKRFTLSARTLREDFCGAFANCWEWLRMHPDNLALGVDVDESVIRYGKRKHAEMPVEMNNRFTLIHGDVLDLELPEADIVAALNCSFCEFKQRSQFKEYLGKCFESLNPRGMMALEVYCGADAQNLGTDEIAIGEETAIWEQAKFDPVTNHCVNYIHFRLGDGTMIERAFTYDWRLWSPAECADLLDEVGFVDVRTELKSDHELSDPTDASPTLFILGFKDD